MKPCELRRNILDILQFMIYYFREEHLIVRDPDQLYKAMPHEEFVGLTKEERRALPHSNDMKIIHEGRPELEVGFWQSKFKVGDHDAVHDLPYTVKANDGTKTEKSDDNALKMMRSIVDMPNRVNSFKKGKINFFFQH